MKGGDSHGGHAWHGVHPVKRLLNWMQAERRDLWVAVIYSIAVGLLSLVVPIATQALVNTIAFGMLMTPLVVLVVIVLAALILSGVLYVMRLYVVEVLQRRVFVRISTDVVYRLLRVRMDGFDKGYGPELVNRFFEVVTVQKAGATLIVDGLNLFIQTAVGLAVMAAYDPLLLVFDIVLVVAVVVILVPLSGGALETAVKESKAKYAMAAWLEELARHPTTFKSAGGQAYAVSQADALATGYLKYRALHFRVLLRQTIGAVGLQAIGTAALLGAGGYLVIQQRLTIGQLVAAELIVAVVLSGIAKLGKQLENFYDLLAAVDKLGYFTDLPLEKSGPEKMLAAVGGASLELKDVNFAHEAYPRPILIGANWHIEAGARVGLMAASGMGKSTALDVVYGLRPPQSGVIEFDGRDTRDLRLEDLRGQIALVRQPEVFQGTIVENVRLGDPHMTLDEVRAALRMAGLLEDVQALPDGIQTELVTTGLPLSQGQVIRLMLARAVASRPRLLILDEILDPIDDFAECARLVDRLFDRANPWTLIVVSQRADVLDRCDARYVLKQGTIERAKP
ncbi:MAG: ATP-binding cassette domain-containing protein [Bryobacteraceae bacterium]|nr:ATP-binding cassette domain-containing protein [Bryobacteraceae bacterium]